MQAIPIPLSKVSNTQLIFNLASKKLGFEFAIISVQGVFISFYLIALENVDSILEWKLFATYLKQTIFPTNRHATQQELYAYIFS